MLKKIHTLIILACTLSAICQAGKGPVVRYSFNSGTTKDEAGSNDAKAYGLTLTHDRFGNAGSAYFFHGNYDSYLCLGTDSVLKPKRGSISLWVKMEKIAYKGQGITCNPFINTRAFGGDDFNEAYAIAYDFATNKPEAATSISELRQSSLLPEKTKDIQRWYHFVLTYDDNYACLYIDGALEAKATKNFETIFYKGDSVLVGLRYGEKNRRTFAGSMDDIEIYDRVLSPAEVLSLYNAPNPNKNAIMMRWALIGLLLVLVLFLVIWWVRRRIARAVNAEKEKSRINARLIELEMRALRAQMNPHFIFNALNTLQRFVLEDEKDKSYTYLIEFSRLLRKLLESSESDTTSLQEEMEILTSYLEIEKLRFDNSFEYHISSDIEQPVFVYIPVMLVQPFVENAIWHGLLNKKGLRRLTISFKNIDDKKILCEIDDNGVGRDYKSKEDDLVKKKSLAIDFIKQRLELIEQSTGVRCSLSITDKKDSSGNSLGTAITIIIPKINS